VLQEEDGKCIWYGQCYTDEKGKIKNCYNETEPPVMDDVKGLEILQRRCPYLYNESNENGKIHIALYGLLYVL
jgi:hypothetical protein